MRCDRSAVVCPFVPPSLRRLPFFIATLVLVAILTLFPSITLWLPHSAGMT